DAMCAFAYIYNELLPDNFTDKNKLNTAFLGYALQLDEGQIEGILGIFSSEMADSYYYLNFQEDKNALFEFFKSEIDDLLLDPNNIIGSSDCVPSDVIRLDATHFMCPAFFDFTLSSNDPSYTENVYCLSTSFHNNSTGQNFLITTKNLFIKIEMNAVGVTPCSAMEIAANAMNMAYINTANTIPLPQGKRLRDLYRHYLYVSLRKITIDCSGDHSSTGSIIHFLGDNLISEFITLNNTTTTHFVENYPICP
ncbi:MAG: hypothetical protein KA974_11590, partial [Saprospiraceae bacterium]|nr:hypothetical protein [Saprospiraceae bacterium]MBP7680104.1 hypothetical protein [Saprospiraceae bacterium]